MFTNLKIESVYVLRMFMFNVIGYKLKGNDKN